MLFCKCEMPQRHGSPRDDCAARRARRDGHLPSARLIHLVEQLVQPPAGAGRQRVGKFIASEKLCSMISAFGFGMCSRRQWSMTKRTMWSPG